MHERILTANERYLPWVDVLNILDALTAAINNKNVEEIKSILKNAPLEYQPLLTIEKTQTQFEQTTIAQHKDTCSAPITATLKHEQADT